MAGPDILAVSDLRPIAEWTTRWQGWAPQVRPGKWGGRMDKYARPLRSRWLYPIFEAASGKAETSIPFEVWVDHASVIYYVPDSRPTDPVHARPDPRQSSDTVTAAGMSIPQTDENGQALTVRLLATPFRLPGETLRKLSSKSLRSSLRRSIPPLWTWESGDDPAAEIHSSDGMYLVPEERFIDRFGSPEAVWIASDPFEIAVNRSEEYLRRLKRYRRVFEPEDDDGQRERARLQLAYAIDSSVLQTSMERKIKDKVDITRLNRALKDDRETHQDLHPPCEKAGRRLCRVLGSRLFEHLQEAAFLDEDPDSGRHEYSEAVVALIATLEGATRELAACKRGLELLAYWADGASKDDSHWLTRLIDPQKPPSKRIFKSVRWASKSVVSLIAELGPKVLIRRRASAHQVLSAWEKLGVVSATAIEGAVKATKIQPGPALEYLGISSPHAVSNASHVDLDVAEDLQRWIDGGNKAAVRDRAFTHTTKATFVLDSINIGLTFVALMDETDPEQLRRGVLGLGTGVGLVLVKLAEESLKAVTSTEVLQGFKPPLNLLKATGSMVYCVLAVIGGIERFEQDDDDAGWALMVAAVAELTSTATYVVMAFTGAGTIVLVVAGAVAAVAYVVAEWLIDDPVARFLEHSEWGVAPYADHDYSPPWLIAPIDEWPDDFSLQARHLVRVLARFTLRWDLDQWPGVTVSTNLRQPDTVIELRYAYRDESGALVDSENRVIRADELRGSSPYHIPVVPEKYSPTQKNVAIVVEASYFAHSGADPEKLTAILMAEGQGIHSGKVDHVS